MLGALGDGADGGLEIQLASVNVDFFAGADRPESGDGVRAVGNAKLAAQRGRRHASLIVGDAGDFAVDERIRDSAEQVADEAIKFGIGDEVGGLLMPKRSTEHAREAEQSCIAAGQAIRAAIGADQFALNTKRGGLKRYEMNVLKRRAVNSLAITKHACDALKNRVAVQVGLRVGPVRFEILRFA